MAKTYFTLPVLVHSTGFVSLTRIGHEISRQVCLFGRWFKLYSIKSWYETF